MVARHHTVIYLGAGLIVATVGALIYGNKDGSWYALAAVWLIVGAVAGWVVRNRRKKRATELARVNARLPQWSVVLSDGIGVESAVGTNTAAALPWRSFSKWQEGRLVILLLLRNRRCYPLPKGDLAPQELEYLRGILASSIAAGK